MESFSGVVVYGVVDLARDDFGRGVSISDSSVSSILVDRLWRRDRPSAEFVLGVCIPEDEIEFCRPSIPGVLDKDGILS